MDHGSDRTDARRDDNASDARITALSNVDDFQVADGYPDPRGWDVVGANGDKIGEVHDLIVDTREMRTRYLDVKLDKHAIGADDDRDVLIPVGAAQIDDTNDHVVLANMTSQQLAALPRFEHGQITREYEQSVLGAMPEPAASSYAARSAAASGDDYYANGHFDDKQFYSSRDNRQKNIGTDNSRITRSEEELDVEKRKVQAGEVDVRKHVETEHVTEPVRLMHEEVTIERRPVNADKGGNRSASIGDENEIRIPLTAEEAVVQKRAVVKEELVITKHAVSEDSNVEADLRREKIDIDRSRERAAGDNSIKRDDRPDASR